MSTAAAGAATCGRGRSGSTSSDSGGNASSDSGGSTTSDSGGSTSRNSGGAARDTADAVWAVNVADLDLLWVTPSRRSTLVSVDLPLSPEGILGLNLRRAPCPQRQYHAHRESDRHRGRSRDTDTDTDPPDHRSVHTGEAVGGHHHRREDRGRSPSRSRRRGHKQQRERHEEAAPWEITLHGFNPSRNPHLNGALARASADPSNHGHTTASVSSSSSSSSAAGASATDAWLPMGAVLRLVDGCEVAHPQQFAQLVADARERHLARVAKLETLSPGSGARVRTVLRVGFDVSNVAARRAGVAAGDDSDDDDPDDTTTSPRLKLHTTSSKSMLSRAGAVAEPQMAPQASAAGATGEVVAPLKAADL